MAEDQTGPDRLAVLWTSGDRDVALKTAFMYALNSKRRGWWRDVSLIVWGPSADLLAQDEELQDVLGSLREEGVELLACKACADQYGVSDTLGELGVDVKYMGQPLTGLLKDPSWRVISV